METLTKRPDSDTDEGDGYAHYVVPPEAVTQAMVMGTPVTAICGYEWVPSRDPEGREICPVCTKLYEMAPDE